jgi:hypothetical protein
MSRKSHLAILENDMKSRAQFRNSNTTSFSNSTLLGMFGENFESGIH